MPSVALINECSGVANAELEAMLPALQVQWNRDLTAVWGVGEARFSLTPRLWAPGVGAWWVVVLDDSDQAADLGYHDLTDEGLPLAKVFVGALRAAGASISLAASHEICEMAVDPWLNSAYQDAAGTFWAAEVCDPVAGEDHGYRIDRVVVSNFVTPDWFGQAHARGACGSGRLDLCGHAATPFQILDGGFAQRFQARKGWVQVTGAEPGSRARAAVKGSRRERRARQAVEPPTRSRRYRTV